MSALVGTVATADVIICCGSGGVGKTTTAAAIAMQAAEIGRRAVVITIDPARRLADALGVPGELNNEPLRLDLDAPGELWALMLDASSTFDGLVLKYAADDNQAQRILANPFYRNVASTLSGTQEFMAAERLHALYADERFDVVIVDTPPTRSALDFLAAPRTLTRFLDHPLFKLIMLPARRGLRVLNLATQPILRSISKAVGGEVLTDAMAFFQAFQGMEIGFRARADEVSGLVTSPATRFVLVASPRADTVEEARFFAGRLAQSDIDVAALVVNRCTPIFGAPPGRVPRTARGRAAYDNLLRLNEMARHEREHVGAALGDLAGGAVWVPLLAHDVHDMESLERIRFHLFGRTG
ncbi:MAG: ArsA-related P-loop ATPase [Ilumatobacteraceae bacterium]|mgnify:CR=1 FL=1